MPAEILGLIGPNGSGKTTLFECLGGSQAPDSGSITHDGHELSRNLRSSVLFYLPDAISPWPAESVRWALEFSLGLFGGRRELYDVVLTSLGIQSLLHRRMGDLSKGQRKRVLLAIGLLTPQPLLVADEPFEGLDLRQTREVAEALRKFSGKDRTLLLSIHQISDAERVCDRFVLLSEGRVRGEGTVEELSQFARSRGETVSGANLEEVFLALT